MGLIVNGEEVPQAALQAETEGLMGRFRNLSDAERQQFGFDQETMQQRAEEWARENIVERTLMRQEALKDVEPIPDEVFETAVENMTQRFGGEEKFAESGVTAEIVRHEAEAAIKLERLIASITARVKPPKTKEVAEFYRKHRQNFTVAESIRASHIVKHVNEETTKEDARQAIDAVKAELDAGASFEEQADKLSDCPGNGGDLGWFARGKMVEPFEDVVFEMEPDSVSDVFKTVFGFHIAKVYEKKPETLRPLTEVRDDIEKELRRLSEAKLLEDFVDGLKERATIETATTEQPITEQPITETPPTETTQA